MLTFVTLQQYRELGTISLTLITVIETEAHSSQGYSTLLRVIG